MSLKVTVEDDMEARQFLRWLAEKRANVTVTKRDNRQVEKGVLKDPQFDGIYIETEYDELAARSFVTWDAIRSVKVHYLGSPA